MEINGEVVNDQVRYADLGLSSELMRAVTRRAMSRLPRCRGAPSLILWSIKT